MELTNNKFFVTTIVNNEQIEQILQMKPFGDLPLEDTKRFHSDSSTQSQIIEGHTLKLDFHEKNKNKKK